MYFLGNEHSTRARNGIVVVAAACRTLLFISVSIYTLCAAHLCIKVVNLSRAIFVTEPADNTNGSRCEKHAYNGVSKNHGTRYGFSLQPNG